LDGAHTADSATALASTLRSVFPQAPLVLVVAMAGDKELRDVVGALRALRPQVVVFTSVPIAGSYARSAPPGGFSGGGAIGTHACTALDGPIQHTHGSV